MRDWAAADLAVLMTAIHKQLKPEAEMGKITFGDYNSQISPTTMATGWDILNTKAPKVGLLGHQHVIP